VHMQAYAIVWKMHPHGTDMETELTLCRVLLASAALKHSRPRRRLSQLSHTSSLPHHKSSSMLQTAPVMPGKQLVQGLVCPITSASSSSCSTTAVTVTPGCQTTTTQLHGLQVTAEENTDCCCAAACSDASTTVGSHR
jgi:hypothetical protein